MRKVRTWNKDNNDLQNIDSQYTCYILKIELWMVKTLFIETTLQKNALTFNFKRGLLLENLVNNVL